MNDSATKQKWPGIHQTTSFEIARVSCLVASLTTTTATASLLPTTTERTALAARRTIFPRTSFVHGELSALHRFAIELIDGVSRIFRSCHCDKAEATGFAREPVLHQRDFLDLSSGREEILQIVLGRVEG